MQLRAQRINAKPFHVLLFGAAECICLDDGTLSVLELNTVEVWGPSPHEPTILSVTCKERSLTGDE
jgi:hypothetical protein